MNQNSAQFTPVTKVKLLILMASLMMQGGQCACCFPRHKESHRQTQAAVTSTVKMDKNRQKS
jgi:hypothetical protein